jgi:hypothetical protein
MERSINCENACDVGASTAAAAVLIAFAMRECEAPALDLAAGLERMSDAIDSLRGQPLGRLLARDLAACVKALQFHDRLSQQLAVVQNLLTSLTSHALPDITGVGAQRWEELLAELRDRLSRDSPKLVEFLLRTGGLMSHHSRSSDQVEGTTELFAD